ncbi:MAG: FAD-dependent oxidoreductase [Deltaproteobacteria bacterium]|nr:FAD-dependent oxidoreductase [Deltaproteobacteria bacterium]
MHPLLDQAAGERRLMLANEAIARGAIEAGVAVVASYPGTPSTEVSETLARTAAERGHHFEYSTNEKVAIEVAAGAAWGGRRALSAMKQVGLNVAADPFLTLGAVGVIGGFVLVVADDPAQHSSQTEQDTRHYGRLADVPVLEPASPEDARRMARAAFDISEEVGLPVILRITTRLAHMRGAVTLGDILPIRPPPAAIVRDPRRFVNMPANAPANRRRHFEAMARAARISESSPFNVAAGEGTVGIVASGIAHAYALDALSALGVAEQVAVLRLGMTWPVPEKMLGRFLRWKRRILVAEELEPFLEHEVELAAFRARRRPQVLGKRSGHLPRTGEFNAALMTGAVAALTGAAWTPPPPPARPALAVPPRPPVLCAGCVHRAAFYAAKVATGDRAIFENDIGCYTLGYGPPFHQADHLICMGGAINLASSLSRQTDQPVFAYIGDSTFFHSGITGLLNAVHGGYRQVVVILDNLTTAMTGHQPHPGTAQRAGRAFRHAKIEDLVRACGVTHLEILDPLDTAGAVQGLRRAIAHDGVAVVLFRAPCRLHPEPPAGTVAKAPFEVAAGDCCTCGTTADRSPCSVPLDAATKVFRSARRLELFGSSAARTRPAVPPTPPCTAACPAGICAMGYVTHVAAGRPRAALELIRERVAFPGTLGHVCHHPCETACVRAKLDDPLAILALKRHAAASDDPPEKHYLLARAAAVSPTGKRVAVVGAGPAGLQAAYELRLRGHDVTVFDRAREPGGLMASAIPAHRLPREVLRREIDVIRRMGVTLRMGAELGRDVDAQALLAGPERFDALFLATGAGRTRRLAVPGEAGEGVVDSLDLLAAAADASPLPGGATWDPRRLPGARVVVVGGGNAAIDAARTARRQGAGSVVVAYRRTAAEMSAEPGEREAAEREGVRFELLAGPVEVLRRDDRVAGLRCARMRLVEPDGSGRARPVPVPGEEFELDADLVVVAVGQEGHPGPAEALGLAVDPAGRIEVDATTLATKRAGVFAGGDAVSGPWTVVDAIAAGKRAAWGIDVFLRGAAAAPLDLPAVRTDDSWQVPEPGRVVRERRLWEGDAQDHAQAEAARCLACGMCGHCLACVETLACPAIVVREGKAAIDATSCNGCSVCAQMCPNGAIAPGPWGSGA